MPMYIAYIKVTESHDLECDSDEQAKEEALVQALQLDGHLVSLERIDSADPVKVTEILN